MADERRRNLILIGLGLLGAGGVLALQGKAASSSGGPPSTPHAYYLVHAGNIVTLRTADRTAAIARSRALGCGSWVTLEGAGSEIYRAACPLPAGPPPPKVIPPGAPAAVVIRPVAPIAGMLERIRAAVKYSVYDPAGRLVPIGRGSVAASSRDLATTSLSDAINTAKVSPGGSWVRNLKTGARMYTHVAAITLRRQPGGKPPPPPRPVPPNAAARNRPVPI